MFVGDVVAEHARVLHEAERRMKKEELVDDSSSAAFDAAKFAANGPQVGALVFLDGPDIYCCCLLLCQLKVTIRSNLHKALYPLPGSNRREIVLRCTCDVLNLGTPDFSNQEAAACIDLCVDACRRLV